MYTYKDFMTNKIKTTRGKFVGWQKGGILGAWGAVFANRSSQLFIPRYLLTQETLARLPKAPDVGGKTP